MIKPHSPQPLMKLIHTADWHLGQNFFEYSRIGEQKVFFALAARSNCGAEVLSAGIYSYVLLGDGAASEAKQMILTK